MVVVTKPRVVTAMGGAGVGLGLWAARAVIDGGLTMRLGVALTREGRPRQVRLV